jgi:hypothetical protein
MTLALTALTEEDVWRELAERFASPPDREALLRALISEHMRALVFAGAIRSAEFEIPQRAHTTRLTASARRNLAPLSSDVLSLADGEDVASLTLAAMAELGDVVNIGGGLWLAAPLRFIASSNTEDLILVGGIPRESVESDTGCPLSLAGASRFILSPDAGNRKSLAASVQPIDAWLGPVEPIAAWTESVLAAHRQRLSAPEEISADQLEIYAPDIARQQRGSGFWLPISRIARALPGPRLCRPLQAFARAWARPHYLGLFDYKGGALVLRQSALVEYDISRRLQFGFDQLLSTSRNVPVAVAAKTCTLDLRFGLPTPEARVLSLGWQRRPVRPQTRHSWTFHRAAAPFVCHALRRLGVTPTITLRSS